MVYIKKWNEFQAQSIALYEASPTKARYVVKVRPSDQWLVLKVTDDVKTLKYKTRSSIILNRFESFNRDMLAAMSGSELPTRALARKAKEEALAAAAAAAKTAAKGAAGGTQQADKAAAGGAAEKINVDPKAAEGPGKNSGQASGGGGKGKKKKKGKK